MKTTKLRVQIDNPDTACYKWPTGFPNGDFLPGPIFAPDTYRQINGPITAIGNVTCSPAQSNIEQCPPDRPFLESIRCSAVSGRCHRCVALKCSGSGDHRGSCEWLPQLDS